MGKTKTATTTATAAAATEGKQQSSHTQKTVARPQRLKRLPRYGEGTTRKTKLVDGKPSRKNRPSVTAKRRQKFYEGGSKGGEGARGCVVLESTVRTNSKAARDAVLSNKVMAMLMLDPKEREDDDSDGKATGSTFTFQQSFVTLLAGMMDDYVNRTVEAAAIVAETGDSSTKIGKELSARDLGKIEEVRVACFN